MIEGFLFNGVYMVRAGHGVDETVEDAVLVYPNAAYPPVTVAYSAVMPAKEAENFLVIELLVKRCFLHENTFRTVSLLSKYGSNYIIHVLHRDEFYISLHVIGDLAQFPLIILGNEDCLHLGPQCGQGLLL